MIRTTSNKSNSSHININNNKSSKSSNNNNNNNNVSGLNVGIQIFWTNQRPAFRKHCLQFQVLEERSRMTYWGGRLFWDVLGWTDIGKTFFATEILRHEHPSVSVVSGNAFVGWDKTKVATRQNSGTTGTWWNLLHPPENGAQVNHQTFCRSLHLFLSVVQNLFAVWQSLWERRKTSSTPISRTPQSRRRLLKNQLSSCTAGVFSQVYELALYAWRNLQVSVFNGFSDSWKEYVAKMYRWGFQSLILY